MEQRRGRSLAVTRPGWCDTHFSCPALLSVYQRTAAQLSRLSIDLQGGGAAAVPQAGQRRHSRVSLSTVQAWPALLVSSMQKSTCGLP